MGKEVMPAVIVAEYRYADIRSFSAEYLIRNEVSHNSLTSVEEYVLLRV